jgi:hypothetical protein
LLEQSPNFSAMVESCAKTMQKFEISAKGRFILETVPQLFNPRIIKNYDTEQHKKLFDKPSKIDEKVLIMSQRFFDDYVISDFVNAVLPESFNFNM